MGTGIANGQVPKSARSGAVSNAGTDARSGGSGKPFNFEFLCWLELLRSLGCGFLFWELRFQSGGSGNCSGAPGVCPVWGRGRRPLLGTTSPQAKVKAFNLDCGTGP